MTSMQGLVAAAPVPLAYAFTVGLVAAVNPCGFPLLPAYLAIFAWDGSESGVVRKTVRGLAAGASVSAGFVLVFGAIGLMVESGVRLVVSWVPWVMIPLAMAMAVLGVLTAFGRQVHIRVPAVRGAESRRTLGMVTFGMAYAVASLSCALPVFLAGVAGSFTRLGFLAGAATFVAYALGMGLLLIALSVAVANAGVSAVGRLRQVTRFVPRVMGVILTLVGAYLVLYWVSDLVAPTSTPVPVRLVEDVQSSLSAWLANSSRLIGVVLGVAVVTALVLVAIALRRPPVEDTRGEQVGAGTGHKAGPREEDSVSA